MGNLQVFLDKWFSIGPQYKFDNEIFDILPFLANYSFKAPTYSEKFMQSMSIAFGFALLIVLIGYLLKLLFIAKSRLKF